MWGFFYALGSIYIYSHKLRELTKVNSEPKRHNSTQFTTNITLWPWETFSKLQFKEFRLLCMWTDLAIAQIASTLELLSEATDGIWYAPINWREKERTQSFSWTKSEKKQQPNKQTHIQIIAILDDTCKHTKKNEQCMHSMH